MGKADTSHKKEVINKMCMCRFCKCKEQLTRNERALRHRIKIILNRKREEE